MFRATAATMLVCAATSVCAQDFSWEGLTERTVHRRAIEAAIWGMPAVNYAAMLEAIVRAKGNFNQIVYWSRPVSWKSQILTPNTDVLYAVPFINTKSAGPVVLEIPPTDDSNAADGKIVGSITDCWQKTLSGVGPAGKDRGKGGKYVVLPPGYSSPLPKDYIAVPSDVYESYALLRSIPKSNSDADLAKAAAYLKTIKLYPLSEAANPPTTTFVDVTNIVFDATIPYDLRFFRMLDRIVQTEPWQERDKAMIDTLDSIGIDKGKAFKPDAKTEENLKSSIKEAHSWLLHRLLNTGAAYYPGKHWKDLYDPFAVSSDFTFQSPAMYAVDMRGVLYHRILSNTKARAGTGAEPS
jgi:hypothetical protein